MDKKILRSGYNFVERNLLGRKIEDVEETLSIVEFLRCLRRGEGLPQRVKVVGLDHLLLRWQDRDSARFLRRLLSDASDRLMQQNPVVVFVVERITLDREPKLVLGHQTVRFYHIFSKGLVQQDVGYFYSPFSLS